MNAAALVSCPDGPTNASTPASTGANPACASSELVTPQPEGGGLPEEPPPSCGPWHAGSAGVVAGRALKEGDRVLDPALLLLSPLAAVVDVVGAGARAPVRELRRLHQPEGAPGAPLAAAIPHDWDSGSEVPHA